MSRQKLERCRIEAEYSYSALTESKKITIDQPEGLDPANFEGELPDRIEKIKVETLVRQYLEAQTLQMLHENGIGHAVNAFVEKDDKHAIES